MQTLSLQETINIYDDRPNKFLVSFNSNHSKILHNYIKNNKSKLTLHKVDGFREGKWGMVAINVAGISMLVLGHVICLCGAGEDDDEGLCGQLYSHDVKADKSGIIRELSSVWLENGELLMKPEKLKNFLESSRSINSSEDDSPRSSTSQLTTTSFLTPTSQLTPEPKKYTDWRSGGGKFSAHDKTHGVTSTATAKNTDIPPNKVIKTSFHTQSREVTQEMYNKVYDIQALQIILNGGSMSSADNLAERQLVDLTFELSKKMVNTRPSELLGGSSTVSKRPEILSERLHSYHEKMLGGTSDYDYVYSHASSDATEPKFCDLSMCDYTTRYTTIKDQEVTFFKSCVDLAELPKHPRNPQKTDHSSAAWGREIDKILSKLPIPKMAKKSKPQLPKNPKLEAQFRLLSQFLINLTVDNCNAAKRAACEMVVFPLFCLCHRLHTSLDTALKFFTKPETGYIYDQLNFIKILCAAITYTAIQLNKYSSTRYWRGLEVTIKGILDKWDEIQIQSSLLQFVMPNRLFLQQFHKILKAFTACYNRLESSAALLSDGIVSLHLLMEPLTITDEDVPSIKELKAQITKQINEKVLGYGKTTNSATVILQEHVITDMHRMAYMMIPSTEVMNFDNVYIGSKEETLLMIKSFFGSRDFKNLLKKCGFTDEENYDLEGLQMMGYSEESVQPNKKSRNQNSSTPLYHIGQQQIWAKKWMKYSEHVKANPVELSTNLESMSQLDYSTKIVLYLNNYKKHDIQFAELALELILMLPSSSSSEHLWSLSNNQVQPNMKFPTLASRTLLASNAGFIVNGLC